MSIRAILRGYLLPLGISLVQPFNISKATEKPFYVMKLTGETPGAQNFSITVACEKGAFIPVDVRGAELIQLLHKKDVNFEGHSIHVTYQGSGPDYYDTQWEAATKTYRFQAPLYRK